LNPTIEDVDETAYGHMREEAVKAGLGVGEAVSQAFTLWLQANLSYNAVTRRRSRRAASRMDETRRKVGSLGIRLPRRL